MDKLQEFYNDKAMRSAVTADLDKFLEGEIVDIVLSGKDVSGYKEAKDVYKKWLSKLARDYAVQESPKEKEFFDAE